MLEASHDAIIQFDTNFTCVPSNARAAALAQSTPVEMIGKTIWDLEPGDSADAHLKVPRRVVDTGCGEEGKNYIEQVGHHFLWNIQPIGDLHGNIAGTQIQMHDITERKLVEEELQVRVRQQAVIAHLGQRALAGIELSVLMDEMVEQLAETLRLEYSRTLELLPDDSALLLRQASAGKKGGRVRPSSARDPIHRRAILWPPKRPRSSSICEQRRALAAPRFSLNMKSSVARASSFKV